MVWENEGGKIKQALRRDIILVQLSVRYFERDTSVVVKSKAL